MVSVKQASSKALKVKKPQKVVKVEKKKKTKPAKELPSKVLLSEENHIKKAPQAVVNVSKEKKKAKYVMPSKAVSEELVTSALNVLKQLTVHYKKKNSIFDDEVAIYVQISCIKIQSTRGNVKFVLPHSTVASTGEVCLITPDLKKGKKIDHEPSVEHWEEKLRSAGVTSVKTVLPMRQLRVEYDQFEMKRRLLTQHDFVMVDTRVLSHVSHVLGKQFFRKHNMLIPVRIKESDLKKEIDVGLRSAMLRLNEGDTSMILVGHTGMPQKQVKDNIMSVVKQFKERFPGGEANIRQISIKYPLSMALPLYLTLRPSSTIGVPKMKQHKPKHFTTVEDELSTIPGSTVRVAPDGTVHVKKRKSEDFSDMEDEEQAESNKEESGEEK